MLHTKERLILMSTITIRLNQDEERLFEEYAKLQDQPLSTLLKKTLEEKIEDEFDLDAIKQYEERRQSGETEYYNHDEVKEILGL